MSIISKHIASIAADGQDFAQLEGIISTLGLRTRRIDHETLRHEARDGSAIIATDGGWDLEGRVDGGWDGVDGPATRAILRRRAAQR